MRRVSGGPVVVHIRAAWQANTAYYQGDVFTYLGGAYEVTSPYTSGGSFGASDLANTAVFESQSGTSATTAYASRRPLAPPLLPVTWITQFQTGHGWTAGGGAATGSNLNDTTDFVRGSQAAKIGTNGTGPGSSALIEKTGMTPVNLSGRQLVVMVKVDDLTNFQNVLVYAGDDSYANSYRWNVNLTGGATPPYIVSGEYAYLTLSFADANVNAGSPTRSSITAIRVSFIDNGSGGLVNHLQGVGHMAERSVLNTGAVIFSFDDSSLTTWANGKSYLDGYGYPGVAFPINDALDTASRLTTAQLKQMRDYSGWQIGCHATTSAQHALGWPGMTSAQRHAEAEALKVWAGTNGFDADCFAWPLGTYDAASIADLRLYFPYARGTYQQLRETLPVADPTKIRAVNPTSLSQAQMLTEVTNCQANGTLLVLIYHALVSSKSATNDVLIADFQATVDKVNTLGLPVVTFADVIL